MHRKIRIKFIDWWKCDVKELFLYKFLIKYFDIELSEDPEIVICSCFGNEFKKYSCIKIFYTGENITPDFNLYDYAIGFDYITFDDRYIRFPLSLFDSFFLYDYKTRDIDESLFDRKVCSFVTSNKYYADPFREFVFDKLRSVIKIDSGGSLNNNLGYLINDKISFLNEYKFNLSMENSLSKGYITEKIIDAFKAKTIPIYWGYLDECINKESVIDISNFSSLDELVKYINYINSDKKAYLDMIEKSPYICKNVELYLENLKRFFNNIFLNMEKKLRFSGRRFIMYGIKD